MDILHQLTDLGLDVNNISSRVQACHHYRITLLTKSNSDLPLDVKLASEVDISCDLYQIQDRWVLEKWHMAPGPDESDFICSFVSLEDAIAAIQAFYFGTPTIINGWLVPLHRHPEVSRTAVSRAIVQAVNIHRDTFEGIAERRYERINRIFGTDRWTLALQYQFLAIKHINDLSVMLRLRRDLQEAYIVHLDS